MSSVQAMDDTPVKDGASQLSLLWEANATVRRRAATYIMVKLPPSGRINDRACIELNEEVLTPIVLELGARVAVDVLEEHVYSLYKLMKMPLSGAQASALAWSLKRLVSVFKRSISRPHRPRSPVIKNVMQAAGIPIPAPATEDDDESTDYHEGGDEGEEEEELEDDPPMDVDLRPENAIECAAKADAPLLSLDPPLKKAKTKSLEEGSAEAGAGPLKPVPTEPEQAAPSEHAAPVPRPPTDPAVTTDTTVVPAGTSTHAPTPEPNDGGRAAHKSRMKKLKAILESGKKSKQDAEAGPLSAFHVVIKISEDVVECQACGLTGSIDMFNTMECTDNLDTQVWMEDAQPPYDPLCKSLSFEEAMSEPEPLSDTMPNPIVSVGGLTPKTLASRKEKTEACDKGQEEVCNKGHAKPEAGDKDQENPKACDKALDKAPADAPKKALKPEASLPAKPACMGKIPASMSPDEQMGRKAKREKETAEANEEEEQEECEEDAEMAEEDDDEGGDDDCEEDQEDLDGEEMEEEEDNASDEEKPAKRPAGRIAMKKAPKAKAKANSKGEGEGEDPKAHPRQRRRQRARQKQRAPQRRRPTRKVMMR
eukprot:s1281_g10.t1